MTGESHIAHTQEVIFGKKTRKVVPQLQSRMNMSTSELSRLYAEVGYHGNGSDFIGTEVPTAKVFFQQMTLTEKILMFVCAVLTLVIILDFINTALYVMRNYNTPSDVKYISLEIIGVYPVVAVSSLISLFVPRSDLVCELMAAVFVSHCMIQFTSLMTHFYGGKHEQLQIVRENTISLQLPPCCCCCCCLPRPIASERNIQILNVGVLQGFVLQPFFILIILVLWLDGEYTPGSMALGDAYIYLTVIQTTSTLLSLYSFIIIFRLFQSHLRNKPLRIVSKFFALQFVIIFTRLQEIVWAIFILCGIPSDRGSVSGGVLSTSYDQILTICEMFILTLLSRRAYRHPHEITADMISRAYRHPHEITADMISIDAGCAHDTSKEETSPLQNGHLNKEKGKYNFGYKSDLIEIQPSSEKYYSSIE